MRKKVYLSEYIAKSARARLEKQFDIVDNFDHPEDLDAIIVRRTHVTRDIIRRAKKLKVISMHGVGLDTIDVKAAQDYGVPVVNCPGENAESVAELAVAFMMTAGRKIKYVEKGLEEGRFQHFGGSDTIGEEVMGKKLGLIGCGHIANRIASIMKTAFNQKVYCYNPHRSREELASMGYEKCDTLEQMFQICDYVSVHVPLTSGTKGMIGEKVFEHANPNLILVNTARGGIVDETALYEALRSRKIYGACSDVFEDEMPSPDNPLLSLPNFIGTLHVGGSTQEALERVSNKAVDHVIEALAS